MHELEKGVIRVERVGAPFVPIFDGMAQVRMVKCTGLTYNQFPDDLLKLVVAKSCGSERMDVVFGVYRENSIKNAERGNRSTGSMSSLAPLRSHSGALFYQITKINRS